MSEPNVGEYLESPGRRDAIHVAILPVIAGMDLFPGQWVKLSGRVGLAHQVVRSPRDLAIGIVDPYLRRDGAGGNRIEEGKLFYIFLKPRIVTSLRHHWTHPAVDRNTSEARIEPSDEWLRGGLPVGGITGPTGVAGMVGPTGVYSPYQPGSEPPPRDGNAWRHDGRNWVRVDPDSGHANDDRNEQGRADAELWLRSFATEHGLDYDRMMDDVDDGGYHTQYDRQSAQDAMSDDAGLRARFWAAYSLVTGHFVEDGDRQPFSCTC